MESLTCNSCGAPLEVPEQANYARCNHCGQQLAVRRSETATFTEAVDRLSETATALGEHVEELSKRSKLAELDRRWEEERAAFLVSDKYGRRHLPGEGGALIGGIAIVVFGCLWTAMAIGITSSAPSFGPFAVAKIVFPAFGVAFVIFGAAMSIRHYQKAKDHRAARRRYEVERSQLTSDESEHRRNA